MMFYGAVFRRYKLKPFIDSFVFYRHIVRGNF